MASTKDWISAFRLRTLPLALSCILMGAFLAWHAQAFSWDILILCILTTISLQVLSNLANDYGDTIHGADHEERSGPRRAVQSGAISQSEMKRAIFILGALSFVFGLLLLYQAFANDLQSFIIFLGLGVGAIFAAIAYTNGRRPYGYIGLGDFSVLVFFGLVGVIGTYFLFTHRVSWDVLLPALSCGFFSVAVLNINNIRDIESDKKAGKMSIPVRIGRRNAVIYHWMILILGLVSAVIFTALNFISPWQYTFVLIIPLLYLNAQAVYAKKQSAELDPYLKQMALTTLIFVLLFGLGLVIS